MARVYVERGELPAELLRLLDSHPAAAECTPPLDIPGVQASSVEIVFSRNVLLVTGQKRPSGCEHGDAARLIDGELRVFLPRLAERRGGQIRIPIRS